jgi:3'-phosphoadenosine 5'-phosphosulfate sulfotransferase (PAPS reductase)/FAD synthetase
MPVMKFTEIQAEQQLTLDEKIVTAVKAVKSGFDVCKSKAAIAFSGGKDSTVLMHLIKTHFPGQFADTAVIFGNTRVEYPESLKFARKLGKEWSGDNFHEATPEKLKHDGLKYEAQKQVLEWLIENGRINEVLKADGKLKNTRILDKKCPPDMWERFERQGLIWKAGREKSYWWCADQYGYPILGKAASKLKAHRINIDCFLRFSKSAAASYDIFEYANNKLLAYYDLLRKVKISNMCCEILKIKPSERVQAKLKIDVIFKGLLAEESRSRKINYSTRGYLFKSKRKYIDTPFYHCNPLSPWTDPDIWEYIRRFDVPYSELYDIEYEDKQGNKCKMQRNGCIGCFTDYGYENSHMFVLRQTHPKRWETVMRFGMAEQVQKLRTAGNSRYRKDNRVIDMFDLYEGDEYDERIKWAIDNRPCSFD